MQHRNNNQNISNSHHNQNISNSQQNQNISNSHNQELPQNNQPTSIYPSQVRYVTQQQPMRNDDHKRPEQINGRFYSNSEDMEVDTAPRLKIFDANYVKKPGNSQNFLAQPVQFQQRNDDSFHLNKNDSNERKIHQEKVEQVTGVPEDFGNNRKESVPDEPQIKSLPNSSSISSRVNDSQLSGQNIVVDSNFNQDQSKIDMSPENYSKQSNFLQNLSMHTDISVTGNTTRDSIVPNMNPKSEDSNLKSISENPQLMNQY